MGTKAVVALVAACVALSSGAASASPRLGSNRQVEARSATAPACASSVKVALGSAYDAGLRGYRVSGLHVRDLGACVGREIRFDLIASSGASLAHVTHVISADDVRTSTLLLPFRGPVDARVVTGVSVALAG